MPGIAGIICPNPHEAMSRDLDLMVEAMRHEPFYTGNKYVNTDLGLYVGWMSHEGSYADCMPLIDNERGIVLIFSGENFLKLNTTSRISKTDRPINKDTAQSLISLYTENRDDFLKNLNGWFCGLLVDLRSKKVTLFNDRYGMSRVYFNEGNGEFLFASEAKSILKIRPSLRVINPNTFAQYLRFNCVMGNRSLFEGISLLPPASSWEFERSAIPQKQSYFDYSDWESLTTLSPDDFYDKFAATVSDVFPGYVQGRQRVAFSLSAGLDTRVIMAATSDPGKALPCYTFGGPWGELFDIRAARKLAQISDQRFDVIRADQAFFRDFANFARRSVYISDGTYDAFGAHDVYFNQIARKIAPIRLTGKFGSEIVRIRKLIPRFNYPPGLVNPDFQMILDELPPADAFNQKAHPLTRVVSEEIPWYEYGRVSIEQSQSTLRTPYMDNEVVKLMYQAPHEVRVAGRLQEQYVREKNRKLIDVPTNMGKFASSNQMISKLLYGALWAMFKVEYIYLYATPHWMTRIDRALEGLRLERIFAGRQKWEGHRIWIKTEFPEFVQQTLLDSGAQYTRYFEKSTVHKMVARHIAGTHNYLNEINKALSVELICSTLLHP